MGGCSLDDQELEALEAERLASSAAPTPSARSDDTRLPLSWRAAKASGAGSCGKAACACRENGGSSVSTTVIRRTCGKCKDEPAQVASRQGDALCADCLWEVTHAKVRHAVRNSKVVRHDDRVLVAYSGGCSSRALIHYLEALRTPRTARIVRSRLNFDLTVLYVDEGASWGLTQTQSAAAVAAARASVAAYSATVPFLSAALEDVYSPAASAAVAEVADPAPSADQAGGVSRAGSQPERAHSGDAEASGSGAAHCSAPLSARASKGHEQQSAQHQLPAGSGDSQSAADAAERRQRLQRLLEAVKDRTGREDLVAHLRRALLLDLSSRLGCNKIAVGDSSTSQAAHVMAAISKGSGYALPADLQFLDSRLGPDGPAVVRPVKELSARDMAMVCHLRGLPLAPLPLVARLGGRPSLNALCREFVAGMQAGLPSTVSTIVRTASKLKAFEFNKPEVVEASAGPDCCLCGAPFADEEVQALALRAHPTMPPPQEQLEAVYCRRCRQSIVCHLELSPQSYLPAWGTFPSPADGLLPQQVARKGGTMLSAARQAALAQDEGAAAGTGVAATLTAQQMRERMRASIADLLLSDDDEV